MLWLGSLPLRPRRRRRCKIVGASDFGTVRERADPDALGAIDEGIQTGGSQTPSYDDGAKKESGRESRPPDANLHDRRGQGAADRTGATDPGQPGEGSREGSPQAKQHLNPLRKWRGRKGSGAKIWSAIAGPKAPVVGEKRPAQPASNPAVSLLTQASMSQWQ